MRAKRISSSDGEESYNDNDYKRACYNKSDNDSDNSYNSDVRVPFTDIPILDESSLMEMAMESGSKTNENQPCIEVEQVDYDSPEDPIVNPSVGNTEVFETSKETKLVNSNGVGIWFMGSSPNLILVERKLTGFANKVTWIFALSEDIDCDRTFLGTIDLNHINSMNLSYKECIKSQKTLNSKLSGILKKRGDLLIKKTQVLEEEARIQATKKQLESDFVRVNEELN
ncbi:hypothetical protein RHSIM_Rhsim03G0105600 [Rhododendron simsii]|uniref:Uncharacterized protein n=1 Tax=Rhododendron simsii TaxID=118357 RepID=A0A834HH91_RHOSS|nr:hypothetical protein RHSIM_Rhsim03G0105600 [Rhododendron simsii]